MLLLNSAEFIHAQIKQSNWQFGLNAGIMVYQGDLTPYAIGSYRTMKPAFSVYICRVLSASFTSKTSIGFGELHGKEGVYQNPDWRMERNFKFTSPVKEITEVFVWNISKNTRNGTVGRFSPYLFVGAGISLLNISRDTSQMNAVIFGKGSDVQMGLTKDFNRATPKAMLIIPIGIGLEYSASPHISITAETNFRYIFTDYLDGFSRSANPTKRDYYHTHTIGLIYKLGEKDRLGCPVIRF